MSSPGLAAPVASSDTPACEVFIARYPLARWLILAGALLALVGYFAPWVNHAAAGLAILGIDLGEYIKFLMPVQNGEVSLWREGFYLPLLIVSLALSIYAFRTEVPYPHWLRLVMLAIAVIAALNMLPPAWTPVLLRGAEFRTQTLCILLALAAVATSPMLALLPRWLPTMVVAIGAGAAIWFPVRQFLAVLPAIEALYRHPVVPSWGMWTMASGLAMLAAGAVLAYPVSRLAKRDGASSV